MDNPQLKHLARLIKRRQWDPLDPTLISECIFATANIFSSLKLVHIFTVNPHLGPLQISIGRMIIDILKFFFVYWLVLFSFACGLNQLFWYYATMRQRECNTFQQEGLLFLNLRLLYAFSVYHSLETLFWTSFNLVELDDVKISDVAPHHQFTEWMGKTLFGTYNFISVVVLLNMLIAMMSNSYSIIIVSGLSVFNSLETLFWAIFGLVDLERLTLKEDHYVTEWAGKTMFGSYGVISLVVLLNMLIAMMSNSYEYIANQADVEWKYARSKLWIEYFEESGTLPPPFNIVPSPKTIYHMLCWVLDRLCHCTMHHRRVKQRSLRLQKILKAVSLKETNYQFVMRSLVKRYVAFVQRVKQQAEGVSEDDVNEIKQDISAFRYELLEILRNAGYATGRASIIQKITSKNKRRSAQAERRLMKGFHLNVEPILEMEAQLQNCRMPIANHAMFKESSLINNLRKKFALNGSTSTFDSINENSVASPTDSMQSFPTRGGCVNGSIETDVSSFSRVKKFSYKLPFPKRFEAMRMEKRRIAGFNPKIRRLSACSSAQYSLVDGGGVRLLPRTNVPRKYTAPAVYHHHYQHHQKDTDHHFEEKEDHHHQHQASDENLLLRRSERMNDPEMMSIRFKELSRKDFVVGGKNLPDSSFVWRKISSASSSQPEIDDEDNSNIHLREVLSSKATVAKKEAMTPCDEDALL
uniref:Ion transport domain-containing protein n=1 Tax=Romanomermis culicivorax TaxID=13658 RepID=A0A915HER7_ROMCU